MSGGYKNKADPLLPLPISPETQGKTMRLANMNLYREDEELRDMTLEQLVLYLKERSEELLADRSYLDSEVVRKIQQRKMQKPRGIKRKSASFRMPPSYRSKELSGSPVGAFRRSNSSLDRIEELQHGSAMDSSSKGLDGWLRKHGTSMYGGITGGSFVDLANRNTSSSLTRLDSKRGCPGNSNSNTGPGPLDTNYMDKKQADVKYWTLQRRKMYPGSMPTSPLASSPSSSHKSGFSLPTSPLASSLMGAKQGFTEVGYG